ncbi:hypothetical protein AALA44_09830 [Enterococcus ratti]|uniref:hypothetical protein n=1 Tax=Enterococcus ratti TaxID=150033 RepID=UPI003516E9E3
MKIAQMIAVATPLKIYFSDVKKMAFVIYVHTKRDRLAVTKINTNHIEYFLKKIDLREFTGYHRTYVEKMIGYVTEHIGQNPQVFRTTKNVFY